MFIAELTFYLFASLTLIAGLMVILSQNPVHSVLFLILSFFNAAGLFVLRGAEFPAMILVIVYVGAVAVLFMFVVMMLDQSIVKVKTQGRRYLGIGTLIGLILLIELVFVATSGALRLDPVVDPVVDPVIGSSVAVAPPADGLTNTQRIGLQLYTTYFYAVQVAGLILLVAMIGAIVLTLRSRAGVKRQDIPAQIDREIAQSIVLKKVSSGQGI